MPYIKQEQRTNLDPAIDQLVDVLPLDDPAALCYAFYRLLIEYGERQPKWDTMSDGLKALDCAGREYYRRWIGQHEDGAIERNGDIV